MTKSYQHDNPGPTAAIAVPGVSDLDPHTLQFALTSAGLGMWNVELSEPWTVIWDDRCKELFGISNENKIAYAEALKCIHVDDREVVDMAVKEALNANGDGAYNMTYRTVGIDDQLLRWVNFIGKAYFDKEGAPVRFAGVARDVTSDKTYQLELEKAREHINVALPELKSKEALSLLKEVYGVGKPNYAYATLSRLAESEEQLNFAIETAELGTWDLNPVTQQIFTNDRLKEWFGLERNADMSLSSALDVVLETDRARVLTAIQQALEYSSGGHYDIEYTIVNPVTTAQRIVRAKGRTVFNEDKIAVRFNGTMQDISKQAAGRKKLEESETRFRSLVEEATIACGLFVGKEMVIEVANQVLLGYWGKGNEVIGKRLINVLPELEGQPFLALLDHVFTTGETYTSHEARAELIVGGVRGTFYFDFTYKAARDANGEIYGVMDTAIDVTEKVFARKQREAAEVTLRNAVEVAELGTWSFDVIGRKMTYSTRMLNWYGLSDAELTEQQVVSLMGEEDRQRVRANIQKTLVPGSELMLNDEHTVVNQITGLTKIIHSVGKRVFDEGRVLIRVDGISRDITEQRQQQLALETEVQMSSEELAKINLELKAANEGLHNLNEELGNANCELVKSNGELAQYAYVASHDLQEPLRKIRIFSNILESNSHLSADQRQWVEKISKSAERMTLLIKDLLAFSRLLKSEAVRQQVNLGLIVNAVINDFELAISETGAVIEVDELPVIEAVSLQMNQLFYNLIGNALKFVTPGGHPKITIIAKALNREELVKFIPRPIVSVPYYRITLADNGIGFEKKFTEQIFEIFKRLHGKETYPGSGIGLSLCRNIVANHQGFLYAESEPGEGSVFTIILPAAQGS